METKNLFNTLDNELFININGELLKASEAKISIFDRGFLFGDSIYEVGYSEDNTIIFYDDHIQRLYNSASLLGMQIFLGEDYIKAEILKTLKHSRIKNAYIRVILTRGESKIGLDPSLSFKNNLIIIVGPKTIHAKELYTQGIKLIIANTLRNNIKSTNPNAKSGNYLNNVMAIKEAKNIGADDALMLNYKGELTEGTTFNIWYVKDNTFYTPPLESGLLKGITREKVIDLLKENKLTFNENIIYPKDILSADEVFITSSTRSIMPVSKINDQSFGNDINDWPKTKLISKLYKELVDKEKVKKEVSY